MKKNVNNKTTAGLHLEGRQGKNKKQFEYMTQNFISPNHFISAKYKFSDFTYFLGSDLFFSFLFFFGSVTRTNTIEKNYIYELKNGSVPHSLKAKFSKVNKPH